jgi:hypothetical protein
MVTDAREWLRLGLVVALAIAGTGAIVGLATQEMKLNQRYAFGSQPMPPAEPATAVTTDTRSTAAVPFSPSAGRASGAADTPEQERLARVDAAIAANDASRAIYEWREAYGAALRSRRWEALVAVGDAGTRLEALLGATGRYRPEARQAYMAALLRARAQGSTAGMRRVAEAFAALGDEAAAIHARIMAQRAS